MTDHVDPEPRTDEDPRLFGDFVGVNDGREQYGGMSFGAGLFGWLTAVGVALLVPNIIAAVAVATGASAEVGEWNWLQDKGTAGLSVVVVLLLILLLAYFAGGYVAGRMCRFDGARQGVAVWVTGLVVMVLVVALGLIVRPQFGVGDGVSLAGTPLSGEELTWAGAVAGVVVLVTTLTAAMAGGAVGHRYHDKVDRATGR